MALRRRKSVDRLFARFCRTGDPAPLGKVFDHTAPELSRVAAWLGGDPHHAEDLLQRTFLVAIESRASWDPERPVLPWLVGILTNQARNLRRAQRERLRSPAGARGLPAPEPADEAAARELETAVTEARAALHDPYRQVLELHMDHGLSAAEIAEVLRRPPGTVRTQIARGLEMVRERLPCGFVAGTVAALTAAQLHAVREAVLGHAAPAAMTGAATGAATLTGGWLIMQKKTLLAATTVAGLLALSVPIVLGAFGKSEGPDIRKGAPLQAQVEPADEEPEQQATRVDTGAIARGERELAPARELSDPATATVEVRLRWQDGGRPAASVGVHIQSWDQPDTRLRERRALTGDDGRCVLEAVYPGRCTVYLGLGGRRRIVLRAGAREVLDMEVIRLVTARGRVVDAEGRPVGGARIWLSDTGTWRTGFEVAASGAGGRFEIPLGPDHYVGARKDGYVPSLLRRVQPTSGEFMEFELALRDGAGAVEGTVLDPLGLPVSDATVLVGRNYSYSASKPGAEAMLSEPMGAVVRTDGDGRFSADGVPAGWVPIEVDAGGYAPWSERHAVRAGRLLQLEVRLQDEAVVQGRVTDSSGRPVGEVQVRHGRSHEFTARGTRSGPDGYYRLAGLPPGKVSLAATGDGSGEARVTLVLAAGSITEWNPVLGEGRTITGIVLDPAGKPMNGLRVGIRDPQIQTQSLQSTRSEEDGRFKLTNVEMPVSTITVHQDGDLLLERYDVERGSDLVLRLTQDDLPTASFTGRILDPEGNPIPKATVDLWRPGINGAPGYRADGEGGAFTVGPMAPGTYSLTAQAPGRGVMPVGTFTLARYEQRDLGEVRFTQPGRAVVRLVDSSGQPGKGFFCSLVSDDGLFVGSGRGEDGEARIERLPPGEWLLSTHVDFAHRAAARVTVRSGETTVVELRPEPARTVVFVLECERSPQSLGMPRLLVRDAAGSLFHAGVTAPQEGASMARVPLPPGDYDVEVFAVGLRGSASVEVPQSEGKEMRVRIRLEPLGR